MCHAHKEKGKKKGNGIKYQKSIYNIQRTALLWSDTKKYPEDLRRIVLTQAAFKTTNQLWCENSHGII